MPTIRVTMTDAQCVYDADRVVRDSQFLVVEARRAGAWTRLGTFRAADVQGVHRLVPRPDGDGRWLAEDIRYVAGVGSTAVGAPAAARTRRMPFLRRRSEETS